MGARLLVQGKHTRKKATSRVVSGPQGFSALHHFSLPLSCFPVWGWEDVLPNRVSLHLRLKSAGPVLLLGRPPGFSKPHCPAVQGPLAFIPCEKSPAPPQNDFPPNPLSPYHKVGKRRKNSGSRGCRQEKKKRLWHNPNSTQ